MATLDELLTGEIPPHAAEVERAVLGVCFLDPRAPAAVVTGLLPEDFYLEKHRRLYCAVDVLVKAQSTVDLITVSEALRRVGALDDIGGPAYLSLLAEE